MSSIDEQKITNDANNNLNKTRKDKILEYLYQVDRKMSSIFKKPISNLFFIVILMLLLLLNTNFFYANETFFNDINPIFENNTIIIDEIEKESPFYKNNHWTNNECNSNLIDSFDGNLKIVHDTIDMNQFTFIYMYAFFLVLYSYKCVTNLVIDPRRTEYDN